MTVLVDTPRWHWRGQTWAHLVSDASYDELHEFARRLGKRRLGFQGDHYDVDEVDHGRAVALGAQAVGSRELVRRLRDAGLRDRNNKPRWERLGQWPTGTAVDGVTAAMAPFGSAGARLAAVALAAGPAAVDATVVALADVDHVALLFDLHRGADSIVVDELVDIVWVGEPRADGTRSVELFVVRP